MSPEQIENCADCGGTHAFNECPVGSIKAGDPEFELPSAPVGESIMIENTTDQPMAIFAPRSETFIERPDVVGTGLDTGTPVQWIFVADVEPLRGVPRGRFKDDAGSEAIFFYDPKTQTPFEGPADPLNHPDAVDVWFKGRGVAATAEYVSAAGRTLEAAFVKPPLATPVLARWLVIDTETSDLPDFSAPADEADQPRLAAISMIFLDADIQPLGAYDAYVHPDGWEVSPAAFERNGLTTEFLQIHGIPIADILDVYAAAVTQVGVLAAFNARFDAKIMRGELRRAGRDDLFEQTKQTCLMRGMGDFNKSEGRTGRWPSLEKALAQIGYQREGKAHTARSDARAAVAVLRYLHDRGAVLEPQVHYAKGGDRGN
jgi:DNA polymerase III subunit epsilon